MDEQVNKDTLIIRLIHDRIDVVTGLRVELFECISRDRPFMVRSVDPDTGEVGPRILKYSKLSTAARFYEGGPPTW